MNIDLLFPTLTGDLLKPAQSDQMSAEGSGQEFEDMLVQQSKAQQENSRPQKKTETKKEPEKAEQKDNKEEEAPAEEGSELAAALVTSQPVMPITPFDAAQVTVAEDGTVILEPAVVEETAPVQAEAAEAVEAMPEAAPQEEIHQQAAQPTEVKETTEQAAPRQEEPKAEITVEERADAPETHKTETAVRRPQQGEKPRDDEPQVSVEQQSQPMFRDVKSAPVKVGEAQRPVEAEEPQAPQQMAGNVIRAMEQGQDVVRIQLTPANLGSVTVELTRSAEGQLTIVMNPETARAANILTQHSSSLMNILMDSGEASVNIVVNMPENTENAGMMMNPDGHNGQAGENGEQQKKKQEDHTEGVNPTDFLSQLRLGLVGAESAQ